MVWIGLFFTLFIVAELYQSAQNIQLPFPIYLILGAVLAVASNYDRHTNPATIATSPEKVVLQEIPPPQLTPAVESIAQRSQGASSSMEPSTTPSIGQSRSLDRSPAPSEDL